MWSVNCDSGIEEVKDGSGLVRRRLVVRRAEDSWRRAVRGMRPASDGYRNERLASGLWGRGMDMSYVWWTCQREQVSSFHSFLAQGSILESFE